MSELYREVWGDSALYAGMLVAVGDTAQQAYLDHGCIDTKGKLWRNSETRDRGVDYPDACSRDMFMGALLGAGRGSLLDLAAYLRDHDGKLCAESSDNRNQVGWLGWARLGEALRARQWGSKVLRHWMGWRGYTKYQVARHFLGLFTFIEALTVYKGYQLNLVYCAVMLHLMAKKHRFWHKKILWVLRDLRQVDDLVFSYIDGDATRVKSEVLHMRNRRAKALNNPHGGTFGWPPGRDGIHFLTEFPSETYVHWVAQAAKSVDSYNRQVREWFK